MLDKLYDPINLSNLISIDKNNLKFLKKILTSMILIRKTENKLALEKKNGLIKGPVHLGVGQEAIPVAISENLKKTDRVFSGHRSHSHLLALNLDIYKLFAEILGKETGFSKGMGGSMHLIDRSVGFYGSVPIVAGTVSLAVGAGLAAKMQNSNDISVAYIGDGAVEEGVVHESLNLAKVLNVPTLFVIENNQFASHMNISLRQPSKITSRFAEANSLPCYTLDGNNIVDVYEKSKKLIQNIRENNGPGFLELVTYRWYGHVDWREDIDVGVERSKQKLENWKRKDPILRLSQSMIDSKIWSKEQEIEIENKIDEQIKISWDKAIKDSYPQKNSISKFVYSN